MEEIQNKIITINNQHCTIIELLLEYWEEKEIQEEGHVTSSLEVELAASASRRRWRRFHQNSRGEKYTFIEILL